MTNGFGGAAEQAMTPGVRGAKLDEDNRRGDKRLQARPRALALLCRTFERLAGADPADRRGAAPTWIYQLYDSIMSTGGVCSEAGGLARTPAPAFLEQVRTDFLAGARQDETLDGREVLEVLAALDRVEVAIRREREYEVDSQFARVGSHDAIVEVAHDMRSPLNAIMMLVHAVLDRPELHAQAAEQLGIVYSAAFGLNALVNDLVDSGVAEGALLEPLPVAMSVATTMESVRDIVGPVAAEKGLQLRIVAPRSARRLGHPTAVHRVLLNLVTNALKYTDQGGVSVTARELSRNRMEFTVSDTGRGMSRQELASVFTPFRPRTLAPRQQSFSSSGLGLALCRTLVRSMSGRILVDSVEGRGTTFRVELEMPRVEQELPRILPDPWRDELAGDIATAGSAIVLRDRPLRIPQRAD